MTQTDLLAFLLLALANAFAIIGFNRAVQFEAPKMIGGHIDPDTKMILWKVKFYIEKWLGTFWAKPFVSCPTCMASIHSIAFYWIINPFTLHSLIMYPLYILTLAGLTTFINER